MIVLAGSASNIIAPIAAGVMLGVIGATGIMTFDILTFVVAIGALLLVHIPQPVIPEEARRKRPSILSDSVYGFRYIFECPSLARAETRMSEISPERDLNRSVNLEINLPSEILTSINKISDRLKIKGVQRQKAIKARIRNWQGGFIDGAKLEKQLQDEITEVIAEDSGTKEFTKEFQKLVNRHLQKFSENY
jgi:hypothetical protein